MELNTRSQLLASDWRNIRNGRLIPSQSYCDQPYLLCTRSGVWVCVMTTGRDCEGSPGQQIITQRSRDYGATWSDRAEIEPADGPEASYAVLYQTGFGRIYVFYNYNADNMRACLADDPPYANGLCHRVDSLGQYVFRYSDDEGVSWSDQRYQVPVRLMEIDRNNPYNGAVRFFWNVGKPICSRGVLLLPHHKIGQFGYGFMAQSEGVILRCANIELEMNPLLLDWETLPDGENGLRAPPGGGPIAEEQSLVELSDGSLFVVYRTVDGHPACSYSRDGGRTWDISTYLSFADGRAVKHPRAANFVWKTENGRYLYWFHNHGGNTYEDRNPAWISNGYEVPTPAGPIIAWSEPEIFLYDPDPQIRISYPDFLEDHGRFFVTETQKEIARVHEIPGSFLDRLWYPFRNCKLHLQSLFFEWPRRSDHSELTSEAARDPHLPAQPSSIVGPIGFQGSLTIEMWCLPNYDGEDRNETLFEAVDSERNHISLHYQPDHGISLTLSSQTCTLHFTNSSCPLWRHRNNHLVVIVDTAPGIVSFVINGHFCDGRTTARFGWSRFDSSFFVPRLNDGFALRFSDKQRIDRLCLYNEALLVAEINWHYQTEFSCRIDS